MKQALCDLVHDLITSEINLLRLGFRKTKKSASIICVRRKGSLVVLALRIDPSRKFYDGIVKSSKRYSDHQGLYGILVRSIFVVS